MKYHFKIHKEKNGFWAECVEIPTCVSQGDTKEVLYTNMQDAIHTYLQEPTDSQYLAPLPKKNIKKNNSIVEVKVEPKIALAFSIRYNRIKSGLTQKQAAKKLGMDQLYSYQRLEKGCNISLSLMHKLSIIFPALSIDNVLK